MFHTTHRSEGGPPRFSRHDDPGASKTDLTWCFSIEVAGGYTVENWGRVVSPIVPSPSMMLVPMDAPPSFSLTASMSSFPFLYPPVLPASSLHKVPRRRRHHHRVQAGLRHELPGHRARSETIRKSLQGRQGELAFHDSSFLSFWRDCSSGFSNLASSKKL